MQSKLYPNMKRMTSAFCLGIVCVTLSVLTLRLTVFSDMASTSARADAPSSILSNEQDGYKINQTIYFASAGSRGDVFIANLEGNEYWIKVNIISGQTGDAIVSTGFIKPGTDIGKTRMTAAGQKLEDGVYDCIAEITAHTEADFKAVGSVEIPVQIYVGVRPEKLAE